jgi:hypothetical protein
MSDFVHSKDTVVLLNSVDLSSMTDSSEIEEGFDTHDVTPYGVEDHNYRGGLGDHKAKMSGTYYSGTTGPRAVIKPLRGSTVTFIRRPEGTGAGLPQDSCSVIVEKYVETAPVADMIKWSCDMKISGEVDDTAQS